MKVLNGCYSYIGNSRTVNQDCIFCEQLDSKSNSFLVAAVCDGIGGLQHGEIASQYICDKVSETYNSIAEWIDVDSVDESVIFAHFKDAVEDWNSTFFEYKKQCGIEMGTTMTLLIVVRDSYFIIQVGDSRAYLWNRRFLRQLTMDASVSAIIDGQMKSYLDNYIGKNPEVWYTTADGRLNPEDMLIVCCDGFYHKLTTEDLIFDGAIFQSKKTADEKCIELINTMMSRGEKDNISVIMVYAKN